MSCITFSYFIIITLFSTIVPIHSVPISPDNVCTFHLGGKLFSLIYLQKQKPHTIIENNNKTIYINFCSPFVPSQCPQSKSGYSFVVQKNFTQFHNQTTNQTLTNVTYTCTRYSSNSYSYYFKAKYIKQGNWGNLQYVQYTYQKQDVNGQGKNRFTSYQIQCTDDTQFKILEHRLNQQNIVIKGKSKYGCPVFSVSNLWKVFQDNWIVIGLIMFVLGLHLLFFGRSTIQTTIFIASFFIVFAVLGAIFTLFVSPYSSTFVIYFMFLILLFTSTMLAYGVTRLVNVSIFFVGAILGFIIGMLLNSIFCSIFNVYSVWSLVVFEIVCTIPFGLLAFKQSDYIVIASSSLTGAYLVVRPISWLIGGFPNQFLLYQMVQSKQLNGIPIVFFLYLVFILALAIVGAMYQLIKLHRQNPENQLEINFVQQAIEQPIDNIKMRVDKFIQRFKSDKQAQDYRKMSQLKQTQGPKRRSMPQQKQHHLYPKINEFQDAKESDFTNSEDQQHKIIDKNDDRSSKNSRKSKQLNELFPQIKAEIQPTIKEENKKNQIPQRERSDYF